MFWLMNKVSCFSDRVMGDITIPDCGLKIVSYCVVYIIPLIGEAMPDSSSNFDKTFLKNVLTCATMTTTSCRLHSLTYLFYIIFILLSICFHCTTDPNNLNISYTFCAELNVVGCIPSRSLPKCSKSVRRDRNQLSKING